MTQIEELRDVIHKLHGGKATHAESVPVKETWQGQTVWDGIVEVFHLEGHPKTDKVYAWNARSRPRQAGRPVTLQCFVHPALTPAAAVRAFIVQEFRNAPDQA